jgi:hypothetical protein
VALRFNTEEIGSLKEISRERMHQKIAGGFAVGSEFTSESGRKLSAIKDLQSF